MKTLIIHPQDPSTNFLKGIYKTLENKTVITGGITKDELLKNIDCHGRVIMLGHGSPSGLLSVGQFPDSQPYIIDDSILESLRKKTNNIFIWCNADEFVHRHRLQGFYTGMFISEASEAWCYNLWDVEQDIIDESNYGFSNIVSKYINDPVNVLYENTSAEYGVLAGTNPIASFNFKRLFMALNELLLFPEKVKKGL